MTDGRFEKGRWVEEAEQTSSAFDNDTGLEERLAAARSSFEKGLDDILTVGRDLVTTEEGRKHIGRTIDKASEDIMVRLEDTAKAATDYINSLLEQKRED
jgi:hypothetical protein